MSKTIFTAKQMERLEQNPYVDKGMPIKTISDRARHTNIGTTLNIYGHNIVEIDELAADHFSEFFKQKGVN